MASVEKDFGGLGRPYTSQTFTLKLKKFESYIAELTQQDSEASAEERRQTLNGMSPCTESVSLALADEPSLC